MHTVTTSGTTPGTTSGTTPTAPATAPALPVRSLVRGATGMALVGGSIGVSHTLVSAPLFTTQAVRYLAAALVLAGLARVLGVTVVRPRGREWLWLVGIAGIGLVLFNVAVVRGVAHAEPAVIAVALACVPVVIGIVGPLLERRSPSSRVLVAAVVVTAGSVLVEGAGRTDAEGVAWAAVAMAAEAAFTLLAVPVLARHGAWGVSLHSVWLGAAMLVVLGVTTEGVGAVGALTAGDWAAIAYLAIMVTAVAFVLWYSAIAAAGSGPVGLLTGVAPVSAALVGVALGTRVPGPLVWVGMAVVVAGLAIGLWQRRTNGVA